MLADMSSWCHAQNVISTYKLQVKDMKRTSLKCECLISQTMSTYKQHLEETGISPKTVGVYLLRVSQFHEYCLSFEVEHEDLNSSQLAATVTAYCGYLESARSLKQSSINCTLTSLEQFFTIAGTRLPKTKRKKVDKSVRVLDLMEEKQLIDEILNYPSAKFRALTVLPLYAGLRTGELRMLKLSDLDLSKDATVQLGTRRVPLNSHCKRALTEWLEKRNRQFNSNKSDVVFPNGDGKPMSTSSIDAAVRTVARRARLNVSAGVLRNIFIRTLLERKIDLSLVAYLAGFQRLDSMIRFFELAGLQLPGKSNLDPSEILDFNVEAPYMIPDHSWTNDLDFFVNDLTLVHSVEI